MRDRKSLEAVPTFKGLHRDKFLPWCNLSSSLAAPPFLEQPALFITDVIPRRDGFVGETRKRERETPRRYGRNAITATLNLFEVHCTTDGGVNGNATSSTSASHPLILLPPSAVSSRRLPSLLHPFLAPPCDAELYNGGAAGWPWNNRGEFFSWKNCEG